MSNDVSSPLFREEAIAHQQDRSMGDVLTFHSRVSVLLVSSLGILCLLLVGYLLLGSYTRHTQVQGYLVPDRGLVNISNSREGIIIETLVQEGQQVTQGEPLLVISSEQSSSEQSETRSTIIEQLDQQQASYAREQQQLHELTQLELQDLEARYRHGRHQLELLNQSVELLLQRVNNAEYSLQKQLELAHKNYIPELQTQQQRDQVLALQVELQLKRQEQLQTEQTLDTISNQLRLRPLEADQKTAAIQRELAELEQLKTEYQAQRTQVLRAPLSGMATTILQQPGQRVAAMQNLLSIVPANTSFEAHLLVPSRSIGFIEPGQSVSLRLDAFPFQQFGSQQGTVKEISKVLVNALDIESSVILKEPSYRVVVNLKQQYVEAYGKRMPLQAGLLLEADVLLERRKIYQWLLNPLLSVAKR